MLIFDTGRLTSFVSGAYVYVREAGATAASGRASADAAVRIAPGTLDRYVGRHAVPNLGAVSVERDGESLSVDVPGAGRNALTALTSTRFCSADLGAEIEFQRRLWQRRATALVVYRANTAPQRAPRVP